MCPVHGHVCVKQSIASFVTAAPAAAADTVWQPPAAQLGTRPVARHNTLLQLSFVRCRWLQQPIDVMALSAHTPATALLLPLLLSKHCAASTGCCIPAIIATKIRATVLVAAMVLFWCRTMLGGSLGSGDNCCFQSRGAAYTGVMAFKDQNSACTCVVYCQQGKKAAIDTAQPSATHEKQEEAAVTAAQNV